MYSLVFERLSSRHKHCDVFGFVAVYHRADDVIYQIVLTHLVHDITGAV